MVTYSRYGRSRFWAVYDDGKLLCVTVYLKGAMAVVERLTGVKPERPKRKKKEKKPPPALPESPTLRDLTLSRILDTAINGQDDEGWDELEALARIEGLAREALQVSLENNPQT